MSKALLFLKTNLAFLKFTAIQAEIQIKHHISRLGPLQSVATPFNLRIGHTSSVYLLILSFSSSRHVHFRTATRQGHTVFYYIYVNVYNIRMRIKLIPNPVLICRSDLFHQFLPDLIYFRFLILICFNRVFLFFQKVIIYLFENNHN